MESSSAPEDSADKQPPASPVASNESSDDDVAPEVLLAAASRSPAGRRRASEASVNVLQMINEQRRFSVSATSAKNATTGGVTGLCARAALVSRRDVSCRTLKATFHYTDPTGPARTLSETRTDPTEFLGDPGRIKSLRVRAGPVGSGRARVVEFSY